VLLHPHAKRRMTQVMRQATRFPNVWVQFNRPGFSWMVFLELFGQTATDLCYLQCVGKAIVKGMPGLCRDNLSDTRQSLKCRSVQNDIAIASKF
jgi:hypothetical protein